MGTNLRIKLGEPVCFNKLVSIVWRVPVEDNMSASGDVGKDKMDSKRLYDIQPPDREVLEYFVDNVSI